MYLALARYNVLFRRVFLWAETSGLDCGLRSTSLLGSEWSFFPSVILRWEALFYFCSLCYSVSMVTALRGKQTAFLDLMSSKSPLFIIFTRIFQSKMFLTKASTHSRTCLLKSPMKRYLWIGNKLSGSMTFALVVNSSAVYQPLGSVNLKWTLTAPVGDLFFKQKHNIKPTLHQHILQSNII